MRRLRSGEIDYEGFVEESEKLSLEELQALTPLLSEWAKGASDHNAKRVHRMGPK